MKFVHIINHTHCQPYLRTFNPNSKSIQLTKEEGDEKEGVKVSYKELKEANIAYDQAKEHFHTQPPFTAWIRDNTKHDWILEE